MKLVENLSATELQNIKNLIGEAFVSNKLFTELGDEQSRRDIVLKYMDAYVDFVYKSKALYCSDDKNAFIGLNKSCDKNFVQQIILILKIFFIIPKKSRKNFFKHINQITVGDKQYSKCEFIEVLMVVVDKNHQGKGYAKQLINFAKSMANDNKIPVLVNTDMEAYKDIYVHYGFEFYNKITAFNGITRFNLVWKPKN